MSHGTDLMNQQSPCDNDDNEFEDNNPKKAVCEQTDHEKLKTNDEEKHYHNLETMAKVKMEIVEDEYEEQECGTSDFNRIIDQKHGYNVSEWIKTEQQSDCSHSETGMELMISDCRSLNPNAVPFESNRGRTGAENSNVPDNHDLDSVGKKQEKRNLDDDNKSSIKRRRSNEMVEGNSSEDFPRRVTRSNSCGNKQKSSETNIDLSKNINTCVSSEKFTTTVNLSVNANMDKSASGNTSNDTGQSSENLPKVFGMAKPDQSTYQPSVNAGTTATDSENNSTIDPNKFYSSAVKNASNLNERKNLGHSSNSTGVTTRLQSSRQKDEVIVKFHAILSSKFQYESVSDVIGIIFGDPSLGGFDQKKLRYRNESVRILQDRSIRVSFHILLRKSLLISGVHYKYVMDTKGGKEEGGERVWEMVYGKGSSGKKSDPKKNRQLKLNSSDLKDGEWNQYDGYVHCRTPSHWFSGITAIFTKNDFKEVRDNSIIGALRLLPDVKEMFGEDVLLENSLKSILHIKSCLMPYLYKDNEDGGDTGQWNKVFKQYMQPVIKQLNDMLSNMENEACRVPVALTVLTILSTDSAFYVGKEAIDVLCRALLISPKMDSKSCRILEVLKRHFPTTIKEIVSALKSFLSHCIKNAEPTNLVNVWWTFAIPLYHFLSGENEPFMIPMKANHDDRTAKWWGISEFKDDISKFKGRLRSSDIGLLEEYVKHLAPLFEVDYLLPRTIASVLEVDHFTG